MEHYLLDCYIKYRREHKEPFHRVIRRAPWWLWVMWLVGITCIPVGLFMRSILEDSWIWKAVFFASFLFFGLCMVALENLQICNSNERFTRFWENAISMKAFLEAHGIRSSEDTELLLHRINHLLDTEKQDLSQMKEHDDKIIQTIAIPVALTVLGSLLSLQATTSDILSVVLNAALICFVSYVCFFSFIRMMRVFRIQKIANIALFAESIQSVLDLKYHCSEDKPSIPS